MNIHSTIDLHVGRCSPGKESANLYILYVYMYIQYLTSPQPVCSDMYIHVCYNNGWVLMVVGG